MKFIHVYFNFGRTVVAVPVNYSNLFYLGSLGYWSLMPVETVLQLPNAFVVKS